MKNAITQKGSKNKKLFVAMNRDLIKVNQSVCYDRALLWVWDFKKYYQLDTAKIFLFFTENTGEIGQKTWWYHVSPVIS